MAQRLQLQSLLEEILGNDHVYFQPPANVQMQYPCIIYMRDQGDTRFADNLPFRYVIRYQVIFIARDPDSLVPEKLAMLPMSTFDRFYKAENLNHDVFQLYF